MEQNKFQTLLTRKELFTVEDVSNECRAYVNATKTFVKEYITKVKTQEQLNEVNNILKIFIDAYDWINTGYSQILPKGKYKLGTPEARLIENFRKMRDRFDTIRFKIKYLDLEKINEVKKVDEDVEQYIKAGQTFKYGYGLYTITKVTASMIKFKECDSYCIEKGKEYGGYVTSKYMIKSEELQNYNHKKEHAMNKTKLYISQFSDEKGTVYKFGVPYVYTMDFGN